MHKALSSDAALSTDLFDDAAIAVLRELDSRYYAQFLAVNPFYLAYIQLFHYCATRKPVSVRSWRWVGRIGKGGYGAVYAAQRSDTGYLYAVKCIDKRLVKVRRAVKLVLNERRALEMCDSPFVPTLRYAFQTREVRPWFARSRVRAQGLTQRVVCCRSVFTSSLTS